MIHCPYLLVPSIDGPSFVDFEFVVAADAVASDWRCMANQIMKMWVAS